MSRQLALASAPPADWCCSEMLHAQITPFHEQQAIE